MWSLCSPQGPKESVQMMFSLTNDTYHDVDKLLSEVFAEALRWCPSEYPWRSSVFEELLVRQRFPATKLARTLITAIGYSSVAASLPFPILVRCAVAVRWSSQNPGVWRIDREVKARMGLSSFQHSDGGGSIFLLQSIVAMCSAQMLPRLRRGETVLPIDLVRRVFECFVDQRRTS